MAISLSEILQARGDADYANGGEGGVVSPEAYNSAIADQYLSHAADLQYNANRYLAEQHNLNLQNTLKGLQDVDFKDMLPADHDQLMQDYADVLQNTANNFGAVRNPLSNPEAWAALKQKEAAFRGKLSQSQQDAAYLKQQQDFVRMHPDFDSPQYQQQVQDFLNTPVGQRKYFVPTPPSIFDPATVYKAANEASKKKYANATSNGKYITTAEGEQYDPDRFNALTAPGQLTGTDAYGRPLEQLRVNAYNSLPANIKPATYADYVAQQQKNWLALNQQNRAGIDADPYGTIQANYAKQLALQKQRENFEAEEQAKEDDLKLQIAGLKTKEGTIDPNATGAYVNKLYHDMVTGDQTHGMDYRANLQNPNVPNSILQSIYGDNTPVKLTSKNVTGDKTTGTSQTAESLNTLPTISIVGNKITPDGRVFIMRRNNLTGKAEAPLYVPKEQFYNDLSGIFGSKNAPKVQEAARDWLQKNTGEVTPDVEKLHAIFAPGTQAPVINEPPAANSVDEINKKLGDPNYEYTTPGGQKVTMDDLKKHYSADQIQNYLTSGVLK